MIQDSFEKLTPYASKPYFYACLGIIYATVDLLRSVWSPNWLLEPGSKFVEDTQRGNIGTLETILLYTCVALSVLGHIAIRIRQLHVKRKPAKMVIIGCTFTITLILYSCLGIFFANNPKVPLSSYGIGLVACIVGTTIYSAASILFMVDILISHHYEAEKDVKDDQRQFIFASMIFIWVLILGSIVFHFVEQWPFERATQYSLVTILTIGYGNITATTYLGKFLTMLYASIGIMIVGFYIISFEDNLGREETELMVGRRPSMDENSPEEPRMPESDTEPLESDPIPLDKSETFNSIWSVGSYLSQKKPSPRTQEIKALLSKYRIIFFFIAWWLFCSSLFSYFEDWVFLDAVYFCFTSMMAIGFGDLVAKTPAGVQLWHYFLYTTVAMIATFFNNLGASIKLRFRKQMQKQRQRYQMRVQKRRRQIHMREGNISGPMSVRVIPSMQNMRQEDQIQQNELTWPRRTQSPQTQGVQFAFDSPQSDNQSIIVLQPLH
ncbi:hypothetical protein EDD86DRAFT_203501 [Gorgonomyces haynaldii]|nr:hypothetical protein EDD86DRAFT_203501 [Gorgonomyces haynaldii]